MTSLQQPSIATEGEACASHERSAFRTYARHHKQALVRLLVAGVALLGMADIAVPAAAQDTVAGTYEVPSATTTGDAIANFAMGYLGSPYVWAANGPSAFDCSGFTQFVVLNTVGIDIGHSTSGQTGYGAWVDRGNWQRGDLVFFANTYGPGITHVGIYIGDGQMIHAENASTGVTISSLYSDYYSAHYSGAYRLG